MSWATHELRSLQWQFQNILSPPNFPDFHSSLLREKTTTTEILEKKKTAIEAFIVVGDFYNIYLEQDSKNTFYWFPSFLTLTVSGLRKQRWAGKSFQRLALIRQGNAFWSAECATCATGAGSTSALVSYWLPAESDTATRQSVPRAQNMQLEEPTCKLCGFTFDIPFFLFFFLNVLYPLHPVGDFTAGEDGSRERMIPPSCRWRRCDHISVHTCMNRLTKTKAPTVTSHHSSQLSRSALSDACCQAWTPLLNPYLYTSWTQSLLLTSHRTPVTPPIFFILFKLNGISQHNIVWLLK